MLTHLFLTATRSPKSSVRWYTRITNNLNDASMLQSLPYQTYGGSNATYLDLPTVSSDPDIYILEVDYTTPDKQHINHSAKLSAVRQRHKHDMLLPFRNGCRRVTTDHPHLADHHCLLRSCWRLWMTWRLHSPLSNLKLYLRSLDLELKVIHRVLCFNSVVETTCRL